MSDGISRTEVAVSEATTSRIKQLPASVVNKIAAGEVIERPASVVKELLENSVDAGSRRITVEVESGGTDLVRVIDDGHGIESEDLMLAVTSHATSKIDDADDLFSVATMGFRGEALASIAEVSQFKIRSRTKTAETGFELIVNGGNAEPIVPCGCPVGTTMEVANLFFNTPVRRKFLRTTQTEMGHVTEAFTRIALPHPEIQMKLMHNGRVIHDLPATTNWLERIRNFFGEEIVNALIPVRSEESGVELSGFVADPKVSRGNNRMQYLFLNHRHIRDRSLQHALSEAYRGLLMTGRFPIAFLRLNMQPDLVDVNVHPAKMEVRFQDGGRLYSQLLSTLRNKFLTTDLTARQPENPNPLPQGQSGNESNLEYWSRENLRKSFSDSAPPTAGESTQNRIEFSPQPVRDWTSPTAGNSSSQGSAEFKPFPPTPSNDAFGNLPPVPNSAYSQESATQNDGGAPDAEFRAAPPSQNYRALQLHNRYLITENEEGMEVIDQHALHERIIYEQLREKVLAGKLETQRMLVPEPVSLTASEAAMVLDQKEVLAEIGIQVEPFGGDSVLVSGHPAMLATQNPSDTLREVVDLLQNEGKQPERRDVIDSLLHMISCKAAIKTGDKLTPEEIEELLRHRDLCQDSHHCPHGRPTSLVFSRHELDKRFKRI